MALLPQRRPGGRNRMGRGAKAALPWTQPPEAGLDSTRNSAPVPRRPKPEMGAARCEPGDLSRILQWIRSVDFSPHVWTKVHTTNPSVEARKSTRRLLHPFAHVAIHVFLAAAAR